VINNHPLWATGPAELLQFAITLISEKSDAKRRVAMILVDNATELTMQTYLTLPRRVTGLQLSRKERDEYCKNFPSLLDGIEEHAGDKIIGLNLGEFEWFHRLRNELYHQGNGLTVETKNVEVYAELSQKLFEALFEIDLEITVPESSDAELIGRFFESWIKIERLLAEWAENGKHSSPSQNIVALNRDGEISAAIVMTFSEVQGIRNQLVHGEAEVEEMLRESNMAKVKALEHAVSEMAERKLKQ
jgi:hypothetical protein